MRREWDERRRGGVDAHLVGVVAVNIGLLHERERDAMVKLAELNVA